MTAIGLKPSSSPTKGVRLVQTGNIGEGYFAEKEAKKYIRQSHIRNFDAKNFRVGRCFDLPPARTSGTKRAFCPTSAKKRVITAVDVTIFRPSGLFVDAVSRICL